MTTLTKRWQPDVGQQLESSEFFRNYQLLSESGHLGDGSFSVCRRCVHKSSGEEYAVKMVPRHHRIRINSSGTALEEVQLLRECQGQANIVQLQEVFQDQSHTYIVLELLRGGELLSRRV